MRRVEEGDEGRGRLEARSLGLWSVSVTPVRNIAFQAFCPVE